MGEEIKEQILNLLKDYPDGLTQIQISEKINTTPPTISKYIAILEAEGKVFIRDLGRVNLVRLKADV